MHGSHLGSTKVQILQTPTCEGSIYNIPSQQAVVWSGHTHTPIKYNLWQRIIRIYMRSQYQYTVTNS